MLTAISFNGLPCCFRAPAWPTVPLEERWIFVDTGKTKAARRRVPLTSRVVAVLEGLKKKANKKVPYVFTRQGGNQPLTVAWVSHEFGRIRKALEMPDGCVLHSLRHSFATRLGHKICSSGDLMKICGWETPAIAVLYTQLDDAGMAQIVDFWRRSGELIMKVTTASLDFLSGP